MLIKVIKRIFQAYFMCKAFKNFQSLKKMKIRGNNVTENLNKVSIVVLTILAKWLRQKNIVTM